MPVNHYVFSWPEGEQPTSKQVDELVEFFLREMGLEGHQAIYGLHNDTPKLSCAYSGKPCASRNAESGENQ